MEVAVAVAVGEAVGVAVSVCVGVAVGVAVGVDVAVGVGLGVAVAVDVDVAVVVGVAVAVAVGVDVGVGVADDSGVAVIVAVGDWVGVGVDEDVDVAVGAGVGAGVDGAGVPALGVGVEVCDVSAVGVGVGVGVDRVRIVRIATASKSRSYVHQPRTMTSYSPGWSSTTLRIVLRSNVTRQSHNSSGLGWQAALLAWMRVSTSVSRRLNRVSSTSAGFATDRYAWTRPASLSLSPARGRTVAFPASTVKSAAAPMETADGSRSPKLPVVYAPPRKDALPITMAAQRTATIWYWMVVVM